MSTDITRIPPFYYIHVQDRTNNVIRLEKGPQTFVRKDHEIVTTGKSPIPFVILPPLHYCVINDPIMRDKDD